jgi:hypothetical protein
MKKHPHLSPTCFALILFCLILVLLYSVVCAETTADTVTIRIPEIWAMPGDTALLPISISLVTEADQVWSLEGRIDYDSSVVQPIGVSNELTLTETWTTTPTYHATGNSLRIAYGGIYSLTGSGAVLTVMFTVSEAISIGQNSALQFGYFMLNEGIPPVTLKSAQFTAGESSQIALSASGYDFGHVALEDSSHTQFTITNQGVADLIVLDIYSESDQCSYGSMDFPLSLETGQTLQLNVTFHPTIEDSLNSRIKITSNDPTHPITTIALSGESFDPMGIEDELHMNQLPDKYRLDQNFPNPFNPTTDIRYEIEVDGSPIYTDLTIYNTLGQKIRTLVHTSQGPGIYTVTWDATDNQGNNVPSGIYIYSIKVGEFTQTKRMVYIR